MHICQWLSVVGWMCDVNVTLANVQENTVPVITELVADCNPAIDLDWKLAGSAQA